MTRHFLAPALLAGLALASSPALANDFRWGASSAAYQVESAPTVDGKGPSIWEMTSTTKTIAALAFPALSLSTFMIASNI